MHIAIVYEGVIPAKTYGGIQRSIWYLGKELVHRGHTVTYIVAEGSECPFATVQILDPEKTIASQLPGKADIFHVCHLSRYTLGEMTRPYIYNLRGNIYDDRPLDLNTVFISRKHASRYGSDVFVYNGMDWEDYGPVRFDNERNYFHFLGKAAWRIKNLRGAIKVIHKTPSEKLWVLGGSRLNINMGFRLTLSHRVRFFGMVGGEHKNKLLQGSKGLVFPVLWDEPFGNAMTESLYFGCPVFGTPYGSQGEIVQSDVGFLSNDSDEMAAAILEVGSYSRKHCHEYARDSYNSGVMCEGYLDIYERVLNEGKLHSANPRLLSQHSTKKLAWK